LKAFPLQQFNPDGQVNSTVTKLLLVILIIRTLH